MCNNCYHISYHRFETEDQFTLFDKKFTIKVVNEGSFKPLMKEDSYKGYFFETFICDECKTIWCLSIPENAWRGFFLPYSDCIKHLDELKESDRNKGMIGLVLVGIIVILIVYFIVTL